MRRIALIGKPGAGKSTCRTELAAAGFKVARVSLAAPLYDVQRAFYERLGRPLAEGQQDGELLNFLGAHFREVRQASLLEDFAVRTQLGMVLAPDLLLCDDARPKDVEGLRSLGFSIIEVTAPEDLRRARKAARGDLRNGNESHSTELGAFQPDGQVVNSGTRAELRQRLLEVIDAVPVSSPGSDPENDAGRILFDRARALITKHYAPNRHQIATAVANDQGEIFLGLHVETIVGRASVCAESVAIGNALMAARGQITMIVTVRHPRPDEENRVRVVPPCGVCRELIADWAPQAAVAIEGSEQFRFERAALLLPNKYAGSKWRTTTKEGVEG